MRSFEKKL